jgi:hypothetical protein
MTNGVAPLHDFLTCIPDSGRVLDSCGLIASLVIAQSDVGLSDQLALLVGQSSQLTTVYHNTTHLTATLLRGRLRVPAGSGLLRQSAYETGSEQ